MYSNVSKLLFFKMAILASTIPHFIILSSSIHLPHYIFRYHDEYPIIHEYFLSTFFFNCLLGSVPTFSHTAECIACTRNHQLKNKTLKKIR